MGGDDCLVNCYGCVVDVCVFLMYMFLFVWMCSILSVLSVDSVLCSDVWLIFSFLESWCWVGSRLLIGYMFVLIWLWIVVMVVLVMVCGIFFMM